MGKIVVPIFLFLSIPVQRAYTQAMLTDQFIWDKLLTKTANPNPHFYEGSPYLIDSFVNGQVTLTSNASFALPVRYNLYEDLVEVIFHGREMEIRHADLIKKIEFADHQLVLSHYPGKNKEVRGFLFLLDSGKISLLHKKVMVFEEWQPAKALESGPTPAKFRVDHNDFFIRITPGSIYKIKTIKELSELFPDNHPKIKAYIKENKVKFKQEHLVHLINYYNSL